MTAKLPMGDDAVKDNTGRGWNEWCAILDGEGADKLAHTEIAALVHDKYQGGSWWSQMVAVGYERLRGLRTVGESRDGTFSASASKTLPIDAGIAHDYFTDPVKRTTWLGEDVIIRTATKPKSVRITWPDESSADVWITAKGDAKCSVGIDHRKLDSAESAAALKSHWGEALARLAEQVKP